MRPLMLTAWGVLGFAPGRADVVATTPLDTVLVRFVRAGRVDYGALARDRGALLRFLAASERADPDRFGRRDQIAFWIDVYNARVLEGVIAHPGLGSVLAADTAHGGPGFFHTRRLSAGRRLSLDEIEGELRRRWHEPRIHFLLNCASASCPELAPRAVRGATLDSMLEDGTRRFLADPARNRRGPDGVPELSAIFQWYRGDFATAPGGLETFVARYWTQGKPPRRGAEIRFLPYDWSLNGSW